MNKLKSVIIAAAFAGAGSLAIIGCKSSGNQHDHSGHSHGSAAAKPYSLKTCIVTDEALGGHGDAVAFVYEGQEIKLCCEGCREDFDKEPAKYLSKLSATK